MNSVIKNNASFVWDYYAKRIGLVDDNEFITTSNSELKDFLKFNYKDMLNIVIKNAKEQGKSSKQTKYEYIKFKRTIAKLVGEGVLAGDFSVSYSERDILNEFPIFDKENFEIYPTNKTISILRVNVIQTNVDMYNNYAKENGKKEISDLRGLRNFLVNGLKVGEHNATVLTKIYNEVKTTQSVWNIK